jgi:hypothetical protein
MKNVIHYLLDARIQAEVSLCEEGVLISFGADKKTCYGILERSMKGLDPVYKSRFFVREGKKGFDILFIS